MEERLGGGSLSGMVGRSVRFPGIEQHFWARKPDRSHNGRAFIFCPGDCLFESEPSPTSADACGKVAVMPATKRLAHVALEVDLGECALHLPPQKVKKEEPTLALKSRRDITRNPKQADSNR